MASERVYEDFEPRVLFSQEKGSRAILYEAHLPDFSKEEIKVTVTAQRRVKAQGERHSPAIKGAENKWMRFCVERPIPQGYDQDKISAKFEKEEEEEDNGAKNGVPIAKQLEMKMRKFGKMVLNTYNNNNNNNSANTNLGSLFLVLGVSIGIALYVKNILYSTS
ncbi:hypothetical protein DM860_009939 [Cuscuta australis]|uniref:SHSP domain-containing protein n=1 Tax=Cuscuta australis TaxID=267555 RepID=A0A328DBF5_9ASTE|nr:hypothetical protein DM860_009939 [Cuscuta australis]